MERLLTLYSEVQSTDVRWLWYPFIAIGKITLLQGDPGDGKSTMMIQVLLEANGLAAGKDHQFKGRYDAEKNAVIISLEKDEQSALSPQKCTT